MHIAQPVTKQLLRPVQLVFVIFLTVSGGPYGLEPILQHAGGSLALVMLILIPVLWDIPTILTVLELNGMMPVNGGYYQWVKKALGIRWAFMEGWWTWLYTFVDLAIYPVLFVQYAAFFFPEAETLKIPICLAIIWIGAGLNILGILHVGRTSVVLGFTLLTPFVILIVIGIMRQISGVPTAEIITEAAHQPTFTQLGLAMYTIMWNFIGWDNVTTYAQEVERPVRTYLRSIIIAFVMILFFYVASVYIAAESRIDTTLLSDEGFPALGIMLGGAWLGVLLAAGGMASALGLFTNVLLSVSRIPKVMADDGILSPKISAVHPRFGTPYVSIILCAVIVSSMVFWSFGELLIIDVIVYGTGLFLEFVALIVLRKKMPDAPRPFRIPLGTAGLILMTIIPFGCFSEALIAAVSDTGYALMPALFALAAVLTAPAAWMFFKKNLR
ncbi:MAG: APC family permease [Bacteroidetes bacterium]|nr:APC family permease [Bacteroidota bacterium]